MSLQVWLPLTKDSKNQGLNNLTFTVTGATYQNTGGKLGGCYYFDGVDDRIWAHGFSMSNQTMSAACWVKMPEGSSTTAYIFSVNTTGGGSTNQIGIYTSGTTLALCSGGSEPSSGVSIATNQWVHIVFTTDGINKKLYINGVIQATLAEGATAQSGYNITLGARSSAEAGGGSGVSYIWKGYINDFRLYDHALSPLEVKHLAQGLVLHYPLNRGGFGGENLILTSQYVTSGGNANGITRTYEQDGTMKIVSTSGNGHWASLGFASNSNTNVGNNLSVGDTYTISVDVKVTSGTKLPTLFINSGNGYKQLNGDIKLGQWIRAYYTSIWQEPGTSYGNIQLHLGFSGVIGTYYFKNFKLEKNSSPTPWTPAPSDDLYSQMGLDNNIEYDVSGYGNNGTRVGTFSWSGDTPRYGVSTEFNGSQYIQLPFPCGMISEAVTVACWGYESNWNTTYAERLIGAATGSSGWCIGDYGSENTLFAFYADGSYNSASGFKQLSDGWHHFVITFDGINLKYYVDGALFSSKTFSSKQSVTGVYNIQIGQHYGGACSFRGNISDVRVYATALSADDVMALYKNAGYVDSDGNVYAYEMTE